jgi:hypothetical protein
MICYKMAVAARRCKCYIGVGIGMLWCGAMWWCSVCVHVVWVVQLVSCHSHFLFCMLLV